MIQSQKITKQNKEFFLSQVQSITRLYAESALNMGYTVHTYPGMNLCKIMKKGRTEYVHESYTSLNTYVAAMNADYKLVTSTLLHEAGIPVAKSIRLRRRDYTKQWKLTDVSFPVVAKPISMTVIGTDVVTDIRNEKDLHKELDFLFKRHSSILIEEYYSGLQDYRVLVLDNTVLAVVHRIPAYVIGNGKSTIRELIQAKNIERKQSTGLELKPIRITRELQNYLAHHSLRLSSIPRKGKQQRLLNVCNLGAGGEVVDVTDMICVENIQLAKRIAQTLQLRLVGIDFLCKDIRKPLEKTKGIIVEVNQHPDVTLHVYAKNVKERHVGEKLIKAIFKDYR